MALGEMSSSQRVGATSLLLLTLAWLVVSPSGRVHCGFRSASEYCFVLIHRIFCGDFGAAVRVDFDALKVD